MLNITIDSIDKLEDLNRALLVASYAVQTDIDREHIANLLGDISCQIRKEIKVMCQDSKEKEV